MALLNMMVSEWVHPATLKKYMQQYEQLPTAKDFPSVA